MKAKLHNVIEKKIEIDPALLFSKKAPERNSNADCEV